MSTPVLILGATSLVGRNLLELFSVQGVSVVAISRQAPDRSRPNEVWIQKDLSVGTISTDANVVVSLGPLRFAEQQLLESSKVGRLVALSSASTNFKVASPDPYERELIAGLLKTETRIEQLCKARSIEATILKPTMIYGGGLDGNVSYIAGVMRRLGLVPYCGRGLRQPVHARDLASLIERCLTMGKLSSGFWFLGGGETLDYPTMLRRIAKANGLSPFLVRAPVRLMVAFLLVCHMLGRLESIRPQMIWRQGQDLTVDDQSARQALNWSPRPFRPERWLGE